MVALSGNKKTLESRTQLDEPAVCASGGDPLFLYNILQLLFFPLARILCVLRLVSQKKILSSWSCWENFGISVSSAEAKSLSLSLTDPFRTLSLCLGVIGKTPGLTSCNNFAKKILAQIHIECVVC